MPCMCFFSLNSRYCIAINSYIKEHLSLLLISINPAKIYQYIFKLQELDLILDLPVLFTSVVARSENYCACKQMKETIIPRKLSIKFNVVVMWLIKKKTRSIVSSWYKWQHKLIVYIFRSKETIHYWQQRNTKQDN